jgi:hypothetical protein
VPAHTRKLPQVQHHLLLGLSICIRHGYTQPMEKIIIKCVCPSRHLSPTSVLTPLSRLQVRSAAEGAGHDLAEPGDRDGGGAAGELQGGLREGGAAERGLVRLFARAKRAQKRARAVDDLLLLCERSGREQRASARTTSFSCASGVDINSLALAPEQPPSLVRAERTSSRSRSRPNNLLLLRLLRSPPSPPSLPPP